ncbi:MAG: DEAD/DEAH box helicase [Gammaproteobacteria bacterium]|nr:MAG: DEAD/DEAH box helicase [Gammaproteobacteria bacterium]
MYDLTTIEQIKSLIADSSTFESGQQLYNNGKVIKLESTQRSDEAIEITGSVKGDRKRKHQCRSLITKNSKAKAQLTSKCSCHKGTNCKHIAATLFAYISGTEPEQNIDSYSLWMDALTKEVAKSKQQKIDSNYPATEKRRILYTIDLVNGRLFVKTSLAQKSGSSLIKETSYTIPEAKQKKYPAYVIEPDLEIFALLRFCETTTNNNQEHGVLLFGSTAGTTKSRQAFQLILKSGRCYWKATNSQPITLGEKRQSILKWSINNKGLYLLRLVSADNIDTYLPTYPLMYLDLQSSSCGELLHDLNHDCAQLITFATPKNFQGALHFRQKIIDLSSKNIPQPKQLPIDDKGTIKPQMVITLKSFNVTDNTFYYNTVRNQPTKKINGVSLEFKYLNKVVTANAKDIDQIICQNDYLIRFSRDLNAEHKAIEKLIGFGMMHIKESDRYEPTSNTNNNTFIYEDKHETEYWLEFTSEILPELNKTGWQVNNHTSFRLIKSETSNWFVKLDRSNRKKEIVNLSIGINGDTKDYNLLPILNSKKEFYTKQQLRKNKTTILDLEDGKKMPVDSEKLITIFDILSELNDRSFINKNGTISLSKYNLATISDLEDFAENSSAKWDADIQSKGIIEKIEDYTEIERIKPPKELNAKLRPYQQQGLDWLQFLRSHSFGGILADDMGLGKTLQTLAHILVEKEQGRLTKPALIITPTSLVFNWKQEIQNFTPSLSLLTLQGEERKDRQKDIDNFDIVITTYPLIHRDKDIFLLNTFSILVLDESQAIKNPRTQTARAINLIDAKHKICLTGTPVENHLGELWSQTNLVAPGLLGNMKQFNTLFQDPIENEQSHERKIQLQRRIKPFVMRRTKAEVETDLPPKTTIIRSLELTDSQKKLYESIRASTMVSLKAIKNSDQISNKNYPVILNALLKLRQVCCHPKLTKLDSVRKGAKSSKLELLLELLPKMIEDKRKILIFSQFSSMLKIISEQLRELNVNHTMLTGETKEREQTVNQFQNGNTPVFLISLKAGGSGLNLTAADTVIHYDPWWNPAAEDQATDRAYRIGQDKPVFIYKLISTGTVEEKILQLQQEKTQIAKGIYSGSDYQLLKEDLEELLTPLD